MTGVAKALVVVDRLMAGGIISKYAIGGAFGALFYLEPIFTADIDIFVEMKPEPGSGLVSLNPFYRGLRELGYGETVGEAMSVEGCLLQFLPAATPLEVEALQQAERLEMEPGVAPFVFSAEHLMALALKLRRPKDQVRIAQFREAGAYDAKKLAEILQRHGLQSRW